VAAKNTSIEDVVDGVGARVGWEVESGPAGAAARVGHAAQTPCSRRRNGLRRAAGQGVHDAIFFDQFDGVFHGAKFFHGFVAHAGGKAVDDAPFVGDFVDWVNVEDHVGEHFTCLGVNIAFQGDHVRAANDFSVSFQRDKGVYSHEQYG